MSSLADRLLALHELHRGGLLTDVEFAQLKAREIEGTGPSAAAPAIRPPPPPPAPQKARPPTLNPVVPGAALALGAASVADGGLGG